MAWEDDLFELFDDLESQASAAWQADREAELADRARAEYASVSLASRLAASLGRPLALEVAGVGRVEGELRRVGESWVLVRGRHQDWVVATTHVSLVRGASARSVPEVAWSPLHRLGLRAVLRRLADAEEGCVVHLADGSRHEAVVGRVGADFAELATATESVLVSYGCVAAVQSPSQSPSQVASTS